MDFKIKCAVFVLSILVASVAGVCDKVKGQRCIQTMYGDMSETEPDCAPMGEYKTCVVPLIDTCDDIVKQSFQHSADIYKVPPFNCKVHLQMPTGGVTASCDANKLMACTRAMMPVVEKISQEASAEGAQDINKMKEWMCGAGREAVKCLAVAIKGCGKDMERRALTALQMFNKEPFQCNIDVGSGLQSPSPLPPSGNGAGGDDKDGQNCDASKIQECVVNKEIGTSKILQEAMAGSERDLKEMMCGAGREAAKCLTVAIKGCGKDAERQALTALQMFNKEPFQCNIDVGSGLQSPSPRPKSSNRPADDGEDGKCLTIATETCALGSKEQYQLIRAYHESLNGGKVEKEKLKKMMCVEGERLRKCMHPIVKKCNQDSQDMTQELFEGFNKGPFNCGIDFSSAGPCITVASVLTVALTLLISLLFN